MDRLIERLEGRYGILAHHWDIAIGNLGRNHVDEGLAGDDAFIAPAPGRPVQNREQVWDLAVDLARPDDTVVVERLLYPTSHRQPYPRAPGLYGGPRAARVPHHSPPAISTAARLRARSGVGRNRAAALAYRCECSSC